MTSNRGSALEGYCRWLAGYFFVDGMDRDDLYQEARLAAWLAPPGCERTAARRRIIDLLRAAQRRPRYAELVDAESPENVYDIAVARERLRSILEADLTDIERRALGRSIRGEPISAKNSSSKEMKRLDNALLRARRKLAA